MAPSQPLYTQNTMIIRTIELSSWGTWGPRQGYPKVHQEVGRIYILPRSQCHVVETAPHLCAFDEPHTHIIAGVVKRRQERDRGGQMMYI